MERAGICAIAGRPNVGKSTLLNRLVGEKLAAVTAKPQTTRQTLRGVVNVKGRRLRGAGPPVDAQIVLVDTPGVHVPHKPLNALMVKDALDSLSGCDLVLVMVDGSGPGAEDAPILSALAAAPGRPAVAAVNKIDLLPEKAALLPVMERLAAAHPFRAIVPISAARGEGVDALVDEIVALLPEGPPLFPEDEYTDRPLRWLAAETIREKVFRHTGEEVPYAAAVTIDEWQEPPEKGRATRITATIHVEKPSQKGIVIGKGASKLKEIGRAARLDLERLVGGKVMLSLHVRTEENWTRDPKAMRRLGYGSGEGGSEGSR